MHLVLGHVSSLCTSVFISVSASCCPLLVKLAVTPPPLGRAAVFTLCVSAEMLGEGPPFLSGRNSPLRQGTRADPNPVFIKSFSAVFDRSTTSWLVPASLSPVCVCVCVCVYVLATWWTDTETHRRQKTKRWTLWVCSDMADLLRLLLQVAEKAANVARVCRQEAPLFQLLVQEKIGEDKNKKFVQDFKTLADVVIQEMIRHDVGAQFPEMLDFIHGEESNKFENGLGESVTVTVCGTEEQTAALLATVLDGNHTAASLLARAIHQNPATIDTSIDGVTVPLSPSELGIWIDPIDATSQYIEGREEVLEDGHLCPSGLHCALVLIGVYLRSTGKPVMGVINQPFNYRDPAGRGWRGKHFWGVSCGEVNICSLNQRKFTSETRRALSVVLSSSEKQVVKDTLTSLCGPEKVMYASGAGYKILCVIQGLADVYVLSEGSTFKWDSCAPHALLRALGGGVVDLNKSLQSSSGAQDQTELTYHQPYTECKGADRWANHGGLVAYRDSSQLHSVIAALKGKL